MTLDKKAFGDRVRALRVARGLTQGELGAEAGIGRSHTTNIENAKGGVSVQSALGLANFFGLSLSELLFGTGEAASGPLHGIGAFAGERLRALRLALGMSAQSFCGMAGISESRLELIESGREAPDAAMLVRLREAPGIEVSADWVLFGDYSALSGRMMQRIVSLGVSASVPEPARELRRAMRAPARRAGQTLHEPTPVLSKTILPPRE